MDMRSLFNLLTLKYKIQEINMNKEQDYKPICLVVGRNMTRILRFLLNMNKPVPFEELLENYREDSLLHYTTQINAVLGRLKKIGFIEINDQDVEINKKGKLYLKMISL